MRFASGRVPPLKWQSSAKCWPSYLYGMWLALGHEMFTYGHKL